MIKSTKIYAYKPQINLYINGQEDFKIAIEEKFKRSQINRYYVFPRNDQDLLIKSLPLRGRINTEPNDQQKTKSSDKQQSILRGSITERKNKQQSMMKTMPTSQIMAEQIIKQFELYKKSKRIYQQRMSTEKSLTRIKQLLQKQ